MRFFIKIKTLARVKGEGKELGDFVESEVVIVPRQDVLLLCRELAAKDLRGQIGFNAILDEAFQRTSAEFLIEGAVQNMFLKLLGEGNGIVLAFKASREFAQHLLDNLELHIAAKRSEVNNFVDAV